MPTEKNKRDMEHRKAHFDQIGFLVPKEAREFLRTLAWLHGQTMTEFIQCAILEKAGLMSWPGEPLNKDTRAQAMISLRNIQNNEDQVEDVQEIYTTDVEPEDWPVLRGIARKIDRSNGDPFLPVKMELNIDQVKTLRRILSRLR